MTNKAKKVDNGYKNLWVFFLTFVVFSTIILLSNLSKINTINTIVMVGSTLLLISSIAVFVYYSDKAIATSTRKIAALCATMLVSYVLIYVCDAVVGQVEIAPFALCTLVISLLVSGKSSFIGNFLVIILYYLQHVNFQSGEVILFDETSFYVLFAGIATAVCSSCVQGKYSSRFSYISIGFVLGLISAICRLLVFLMINPAAGWDTVYMPLVWSFVGGVLTTMLMFVVLPLFERLFNVVSPFRYSEIANTNTSLMRKMYEIAPGTFNHSLTVANYVEACASAIGENPFLARAIAYYHDIGKMKNPQYFAENQLDGVNLHDQITPETSVSIIKSHTTYGISLAKQHRLPIEIQRAIVEHHGTMPIKYFYFKAQKYTDGKLAYDEYSYAGPKPTSKLTAILMICDACEAALRASNDKSKAESIVDAIVDERMRFNQFSDCPLTMQEIDVIKSTIITTFIGIKHKRVKYPEIKLEEHK